MASFPCPKGDGECVASEVTVALLRGQIVVGGENLISAFFPEGIDFATADARLIDFPEEWLREDPRSMAGLSISDVTRSDDPALSVASGIIATCSPCGHRWIYESGHE